MKLQARVSMVAVLFGIAMAAANAQELGGTQNGVPYLSGGVGDDSVERIQARAKDFNLKLLFTFVEGNYLADVGVTIRDSGGKTLVDQVSDGPFFLAKLPAGSYTVAVTNNGKTQTRKVHVGAKGLHSEQFRWAAGPEDHPTLSDAR